MERTAIYPGSFDPFTLGHLDIVNRALKIFDKIYIAIGENRNKTNLFTPKERKLQIEEIFQDNPAITVMIFNDLLVDFARQTGVFTVIRGLRAVSDFEYEFLMASTNRAMNPEIESVFFMTSDKYSFLSSSIVKEIASKNTSYLSHFVTPNVEKALREKFRLM
ncbi:pantetheine-phosphate adenylyltransferase [bacterium]|nr:pantetheine-phosphate adenylyltransferase [bacterium]